MKVDKYQLRFILWSIAIIVFGAMSQKALWPESDEDSFEPIYLLLNVGIGAANADQGAIGRGTEEALADAINECFERVEVEEDGSVLVLGFILDEEGQIATPPRLLSPNPAGRTERRLFRAAWAAIEECQPFPGVTVPGRSIEMMFHAGGAAPSGTEAEDFQAEGSLVWSVQPDASEIAGALAPVDRGVLADAVLPDEPAGLTGERLVGHADAMEVAESTPDVVRPSRDSSDDLDANWTSTGVPTSVSPELLAIVERGELTVRAMRAFGQLGPAQDRLVVALRQRDLDLLGARSNQLRSWLAPGGTGETLFSPEQKADLQALLRDMESLESGITPPPLWEAAPELLR